MKLIITRNILLLLTFGLLVAFVAADDSISCSANNKCPEDKPCCSQYGVCGTGAYCLAACDPRFSYNISACVPLPICKSKDITFSSTDSIIDQSKYLGDPSSYDFVTNGQLLEYDDSLLLTMANGSYGTVLSSTRAVWYGKVSVTLKTSRTQGVVSAFILMSPVKDEIDYEFIGSFLETAQTNFYWQGYLNYTNSQNISLSNTFENYHTYTIDWTPDTITWSVDGQVGRILKKSDTYNSTTKIYEFPQTPSIVQLSIWPGGSSLNPKGTVDWAGGAVDWNAEDIQNPGYFYATLKDVSIECYDAPSDAKVSGDNSYKFTDPAGLHENIEISGDGTVLGSFEAVGFDMNKGSDSELNSVSGSIPSGVAAGSNQNREGDQGSVSLDASVVSISRTSTAEESLADATGTASKTSKSSTSTKSLPAASQESNSSSTKGSSGASSATDSASKSSAKSASTSAEATSDAGFDQGGAATAGSASASTSSSSSSGSSANSSNGASKLDFATGSFLGLVAFFIAMVTL